MPKQRSETMDLAADKVRLALVLPSRIDQAVQRGCERWDRGYSDLAEEAIRAGLTSVKPPAEVGTIHRGKVSSLRRGRGAGVETVHLHLRLLPETAGAVRDTVESTGLTQGEVIRQAIEAGLPVANRRQYQRRSRDERRVSGLCVHCGGAVTRAGRKSCDPCCEASRERTRERSERRKETLNPRMCSRCGERRHLKGYRWCTECQNWQRERMRDYWQRRRAARKKK